MLHSGHEAAEEGNVQRDEKGTEMKNGGASDLGPLGPNCIPSLDFQGTPHIFTTLFLVCLSQLE